MTIYNGTTKNFATFGGFQVDQPLLKGFGLGANLRAGVDPEGEPGDLRPGLPPQRSTR